MPPAPKKTSDVTTYMIPIRLWSTVTSQLATLPCFQSTTGTVSTLTATRRRSLVDAVPDVVEERLHLLVRPAGPDGGHLAASGAQERLEPRRLGQQRVVRDLRPVVALALHPVTRCADALELAAAQVGLHGRRDVRVVLLLRGRDHAVAHRLVIEAAELGALPDVRAGLVGLEPRVVRLPGDRVGDR